MKGMKTVLIAALLVMGCAQVDAQTQVTQTGPGFTSWEVKASVDEMTDDVEYIASLGSRNRISQDYPYKDAGFIIVASYKPKSKRYSILTGLTSGLILGQGGDASSYIMARFDGGTPIKYAFKKVPGVTGDEGFIMDGETSKMFIMNCMQATTIKVEVPMYKQGRCVFTFEVDEPLVWKASE